MGRTSFFEDGAWEQFWHGNAVPPDPQPLDDFVRSLRPTMEEADFRAFRNGGIPLFERRWETFVQELLVVPGPPVEGVPTANLRVHVSLPALREFRQRYWTVPHNAPSLVAGGDICLLDVPPGRAVWTLDPDGAEAARDFLQSQVLPWFEPFEDFPSIAVHFDHGGYPLISLPVSIELTAFFFGKTEARRALERALGPPTLTAKESTFLERMALSLGTVRPGWFSRRQESPPSP